MKLKKIFIYGSFQKLERLGWRVSELAKRLVKVTLM
jgi:hypothetical protein